MKRRQFLGIGAAFGLGSFFVPGVNSIKAAQNSSWIPVTIASGNGLAAVEKSYSLITSGEDALTSVIAGVNIVENDPDDTSVGYGGLPNSEGVVELDSCCMHGPSHKAGAVAAIRNIKNPSKVARLVLENTPHVLLVGEGALRFAKANGFKEENLMTEKSRKIWESWKEKHSAVPDNFENQRIIPFPESAFTKDMTGTITCLGIDKNHDISGVTTTSGLAFKLPGRVGDSPIIGAGLYVDNEVGAAGSTGLGEENMKNLTCFLIVEYMRQGKSPQEACVLGCRRILKHAPRSLFMENGKPIFNVTCYALNRQGRHGAAAINYTPDYAVCDSNGPRIEKGVKV